MEKLTVVADREGHIVGLTGQLVIGKYSGSGEGWHNNATVFEFCCKLEELGKTMKGEAGLIGSEGIMSIQRNTNVKKYRRTYECKCK